MRAALVTCSLCLLSAASASAQDLPATLPTAAPQASLAEITGQDYSAQGAAPGCFTPIPSGRPFDMCGPRAWASAEYMLMWYSPMSTPPLVQTVPSVLVNDPAAVPATSFPSRSKIHYDGVSGGRVSGGMNWDKIGVDASAFILQQRNLQTTLANDGTPVFITRPFIDATNGTVTGLNISSPGLYSGSVNAVVTSQIWGFDANVRRAWYTYMADTTDLIGGFRYFDLQESIAVASLSTFPTGDTVAIQDSVRTHNSFYGGQVGFTSIYGGMEPGFGLAFTTKSGIGGVNQRVDLVGSNTIVQTGVASTEPGGLFARGLNSGSFSRGKFAYMQDLDVKLTYNFTRHFQVSLGYSLFYLSSVVRPGDQVNPFINPNQIRFTNGGLPTVLGPQPAFAWNSHSFVMQGITFGARLAY